MATVANPRTPANSIAQARSALNRTDALGYANERATQAQVRPKRRNGKTGSCRVMAISNCASNTAMTSTALRSAPLSSHSAIAFVMARATGSVRLSETRAAESHTARASAATRIKSQSARSGFDACAALVSAKRHRRYVGNMLMLLTIEDDGGTTGYRRQPAARL